MKPCFGHRRDFRNVGDCTDWSPKKKVMVHISVGVFTTCIYAVAEQSSCRYERTFITLWFLMYVYSTLYIFRTQITLKVEGRRFCKQFGMMQTMAFLHFLFVLESSIFISWIQQFVLSLKSSLPSSLQGHVQMKDTKNLFPVFPLLRLLQKTAPHTVLPVSFPKLCL